MANQAEKNFTWVIKNFSSLQSKVCSEIFVVGRCKWRLMVYPKGSSDNSCLSLFLVVADFKALPCGCRRDTNLRLKVVNQFSEHLSQLREMRILFDEKIPAWGFPSMLPLTKLNAKNGGFLVNDVVKIVVEVDVLEVIGKLDVPDEEIKRDDDGTESEDLLKETQPLKKVKRENGEESEDLLKETSSVKESIDVNGFQVFPSQVEFVSRVFKKHPDIALVFRGKNKHLKTACMYVLLSLIETLCKSLQELSNDDLAEVDNSLTYLKDSGFKVDWLEKKLDEVKAKKKEEEIGESLMQELEKEIKDFKHKCSDREEELNDLKHKCSDIEEELKELKHKCSDREAQLEKAEEKVLAARASPLTLDDLI